MEKIKKWVMERLVILVVFPGMVFRLICLKKSCTFLWFGWFDGRIQLFASPSNIFCLGLPLPSQISESPSVEMQMEPQKGKPSASPCWTSKEPKKPISAVFSTLPTRSPENYCCRFLGRWGHGWIHQDFHTDHPGIWAAPIFELFDWELVRSAQSVFLATDFLEESQILLKCIS